MIAGANEDLNYPFHYGIIMAEEVILQHLDYSKGAFGPDAVSPDYLNCIPLVRYRECCGIGEVIIELESESSITLTVKTIYLSGLTEKEEMIINKSISFKLTKGDLVIFDVPQNIKVHGLVKAIVDRKRKINLAHIVCTYRREESINCKINDFQDSRLKNYHMIVVDNSSTLNFKSNDVVSVIKSPNLGGSSGFTRGIAIALKNGFTHVLLNDDDALINPESVFRMIAFLSVVSSKYDDASISGVFLDIDKPNIVRETGGLI